MRIRVIIGFILAVILLSSQAASKEVNPSELKGEQGIVWRQPISCL